MPGVYTTAFGMGDFVDVEGSGKAATIIVGGISIASSSGNVELRGLSIESQGTAISVVGGQPRISDVDVRMTNLDNSHNAYAIYLRNSRTRIKNTTISVSGYIGDSGIYAFLAAPFLDGVSITSSGYGVVADASDISIRNCIIESSAFGLAVQATYYGSDIIASNAKVYGSTVGNVHISSAPALGVISTFMGSSVQIASIDDAFRCVGCYDESFNPIPNQ